MSNMVDVLCEAGTACPSRAYGLTPGFFGGSVLLIILVFCVVLVWFVSVLCLVPTISVSVLCLVPTISVHSRKSHFPRAFPSGNMTFLG
jgi:cobalamin biosynthesis protein CobD/CbiB